MNKIFGLVDCNNFFVSCEKVFQPQFQGRPVVVLSNNDGCVVSRSNEAKKLGIPMGAPIYKYKSLVEQHNIKLFSANFPLYGDLSNRVMQILLGASYDVQIYSIDEAFLDLTALHSDLTAYTTALRQKILKYTGIPVSIGIATSKTLAKIAAETVKHDPTSVGVLDLSHDAKLDRILSDLPVKQVWGIGWKLSEKLKTLGIYTALDLKHANLNWIKSQFSISVVRTILELQGVSCIDLHNEVSQSKSILTSRSFGSLVNNKQDLIEAVSSYACRAAEKLRAKDLTARFVTTFIHTNRFNNSYYANAFTYSLPESSSYNPTLIKFALKALQKIYRPQYSYKKAGIVFTGLVPKSETQLNLLYQGSNHQKEQLIMHTLDQINKRYGSRTIRQAVTGFTKPWHLKQQHRSKRYTDSWDELLTVS